jgi:hypothetical protein
LLSDVTGQRFGLLSRLRIAFRRPMYHARAASDSSAWMARYKPSRSRSARDEILTAYAMPGFELGEKLAGWAELAVSRVLESLTDALAGIGASSNVEKVLIGCGVLHNCLGLSFDGEHDGTLTPLDAP